jgi:glucokinase
LKETSRPSLLRELDQNKITAKDVYDMAIRNDSLAIEIFNITGAVLGEACANYVLFSAPEAIILFGGLARAGEILLKPTRESFEQHLLHIFKSKVRIMQSGLNEADSAILGASALAWEVII